MNQKGKFLLSTLFYLVCLPAIAQNNYRISLGMAETYSYGYFEGGNTTETFTTYYNGGSAANPLPMPDHSYIYQIRPANSLEFRTFDDNAFLKITRIFSPSLLIEKRISKSLWLCTGIEAGSRRFDLYTNDDGLGLGLTKRRSFIDVGFPFLIKNYVPLFRKWQFIQMAGISINFPNPAQIWEYNYDYAIATSGSPHPLLSAGLGISRDVGKNGENLSFEVIYNKGLTPAIEDNFSNYDYYGYTATSYAIKSNGTYWRIGLRYTFAPCGSYAKEKRNQPNESPVILPIDKRKVDNNFSTVEVDSNIVNLCIRDDLKLDGYKITVQYNDSLIAREISPLKTEKCISLKINKVGLNYIVIHAIDEGQISPNIIEISISDKKKIQRFDIQTSQLKSGALKLKYKP